MRYAHINHRYWPFYGGSERFVQEVAQQTASQGHDVSVITTNAYDLEYFWDNQRQSVNAPESDCHNGVRISRVPIRHRFTNGVTFGALRRLQGEASTVRGGAMLQARVAEFALSLPDLRSEIWRAGPFDLIHVTNLGLEGMAIAGADVAQASGVPYVITPFTHIGRGDTSSDRRYVTMPHQLRLLRNASAVLSMTYREARFLKYAAGIEDVFVVGAGVNPDEVTGGDGDRFRQRYCLEGTLIGTLGALASEKGTFDTIRAATQIRKGGRNVTAVFAGPTMRDFESWQQSSKSLDDAGSFRYVGILDEDEKRDMLAALDILVLPSRTESFGIVFLEAWAAGKPVIAADAGAVGEIVRHGENGLLVPFGNVDATVDAIEWLLDHPIDASNMASSGQELVNTNYTWHRVLDRVERAFNHAMGL